MATLSINGLPIHTPEELRELPTDRLRIMYSDARCFGMDDYALAILDAWEDILKTTYPRRVDRQS